jgi:hypothetical protein
MSRGVIATGGRRRNPPTGGGGGSSEPEYLDFAMDTSETQAFTHAASGFVTGSAHCHAWLTSPTRLGSGHSERMELHNNAATDTVGNMRSLMSCVNTNEGGTTVGNVVGWPEVYWAFSSYLPTSGASDANATVVAGFSQTTVPEYEHLFVIHERGGVNGNTVGINNVNEVNNLSIMVRSGQLQFRSRCGTWTWNGSGWNSPAWNTTTPGTNGSNDQIPLPIVKSTGTNATMIMDTWIDIVFHVRFRTDSSGLVELWARQAGQTFTTSPNLSITGPTHKTLIGSDGQTRTSADYEAANLVTGCYAETGLYIGSTSWFDGNNGAHVHIFDEMRRYGTLASAKANWG